MTQQLFDLLNIDNTLEQQEQEINTAKETIANNKVLIEEAETIIDRIDEALPFVADLSEMDNELDVLGKMASDKFEALIDLGLNVEARYSGHILATAGVLLGHAISAKQAKIDRKLKTLDLQLKKARLDQQQAKLALADDNIVDGKGMEIDRTELLRHILGKTPT